MQGQSTSVPNVQYNLVSIAYHNLEGAQTYQEYVRDAQQNGDQEAVEASTVGILWNGDGEGHRARRLRQRRSRR